MFKKKCAYTLVELLVSLAIFSIVIGSLLAILISQNNFFNRASGRMDVSVRARKVMDNIVKELRRSNLELVTVFDAPMDQGGDEDYINGVSVNFQIPVDFDSDGDFFDKFGRIEWGTEECLAGTIEYFWDNVSQKVTRRLWDASGVSNFETIIAENISAFRIEGLYYSGGALLPAVPGNPSAACELIRVTLTAQRTTVGGRVLATPLTYTLMNTITWRN